MSDDVSTVSDMGTADGVGEQTFFWLFVSGNRNVVAGGIVFAIFLLVSGLLSLNAIAIDPSSKAGSAFAGGLIVGTLTVVTVTLSINQLILSRVFGTPDELQERLTGARDLRGRVRERAGQHATPNDPAAFLSVVATGIADRAGRLRTAAGDAGQGREAVTRYADDIQAYGENMGAKLEREAELLDVLSVVLGNEYARNLTATTRLRNEYGDALDEAARAELDAIEELLESVAVTRQLFKTISLQQDFSRLSRLIAITGLAAFLTSLLFALVYRTNTLTVPAKHFPLLFSLGIAVIVTPVAVFIAYTLRAATLGRRTTSVGPFVPPGE